MASTSIMMSKESIQNVEINNKGFSMLDALFKAKGWHLIKNEMNNICYTKLGEETDIYEIKIDQKMIHVTIPIQNSTFQYTTSFKDYFQASEYVEARFLDFIEDKKN